MFYDIYCDLCQKKGLTPSGAAAKIGFNRASITMWKNTGKAPKQDLLLRIAEYFDVSVDYLLEKMPAEAGRHKVDLSDVEYILIIAILYINCNLYLTIGRKNDILLKNT